MAGECLGPRLQCRLRRQRRRSPGAPPSPPYSVANTSPRCASISTRTSAAEGRGRGRRTEERRRRTGKTRWRHRPAPQSLSSTGVTSFPCGSARMVRAGRAVSRSDGDGVGIPSSSRKVGVVRERHQFPRQPLTIPAGATSAARSITIARHGTIAALPAPDEVSRERRLPHLHVTTANPPRRPLLRRTNWPAQDRRCGI